MTKVPLILGALLLLGAGAGVAYAQGAPPPPPPPAGAPAPGMMQRPMGGWMAMHRRRMEMLTKSASFRFKRDGAEIDIKCAADEPTKACVDAAGTLIDKITASTPH